MARDNTKDLTLGGGKLFIREYGSTSGWREFSQIKELTLTPNLEELEHINTDDTMQSIDKIVVIKEETTFKLITEAISADNLNKAFYGEKSSKTQAQELGREIGIDSVEFGAVYPLEFFNATSFELKKADDTLITQDGNYTIDRQTGILEIDEAPIDILEGEILKAVVDLPEVEVDVIGAFKTLQKEYELLFYGKSKAGKNRNIKFHKCTLKLSGDFALKSTEWNSLEFDGKVLKDETKPVDRAGGQSFEVESYA